MVNNFIETKICIIGGGPAGLFAALKLKEHDINKFIFLEKGNMKTYVINGGEANE